MNVFQKYISLNQNQLMGKPLFEKTANDEIISCTRICKVIGQTSYNAWVVEDDEGCVGILGVTDFLSEEDAKSENKYTTA